MSRTHHPKRRFPRGLSLESRRGPRTELFLFFLAFFGGLLVGALYAAANGKGSFPYEILLSQLSLVPKSSLLTLFRSRLLLALVTIGYLFIAGSSLWGRTLIPAVPFFLGLSQGVIVTFLLLGQGFHAIGFILLAVVLPKSLSMVALALLSRVAAARSDALKGASREGGEGAGVLFLLFSLSYLFLLFLEQLLLKCSIGLLL